MWITRQRQGHLAQVFYLLNGKTWKSSDKSTGVILKYAVEREGYYLLEQVRFEETNLEGLWKTSCLQTKRISDVYTMHEQAVTKYFTLLWFIIYYWKISILCLFFTHSSFLITAKLKAVMIWITFFTYWLHWGNLTVVCLLIPPTDLSLTLAVHIALWKKLDKRE